MPHVIKLSSLQARLSGFQADAEKYEMALTLGWAIYNVPGPWVAEKGRGRQRIRYIWRERTMEVLKALLEERT